MSSELRKQITNQEIQIRALEQRIRDQQREMKMAELNHQIRMNERKLASTQNALRMSVERFTTQQSTRTHCDNPSMSDIRSQRSLQSTRPQNFTRENLCEHNGRHEHLKKFLNSQNDNISAEMHINKPCDPLMDQDIRNPHELPPANQICEPSSRRGTENQSGEINQFLLRNMETSRKQDLLRRAFRTIPELSESSDANEWQKIFNIYTEGLSTADKRDILAAKVPEEAKMRVLASSDLEFPELFADCIGTYSQRLSPARLMAKFNALKQGSQEGIRLFSSRLKALLCKAFPAMPRSQRDHLILTHLQASCTDMRIQQIFFLKPAESLCEYVDCVEAREQALEKMAASKPSQCPNSSHAQRTPGPSQNPLVKAPPLVTPNRGNTSSIVCFKCNQPGHIARDCNLTVQFSTTPSPATPTNTAFTQRPLARCEYCKRNGHYESQCYLKRRRQPVIPTTQTSPEIQGDANRPNSQVSVCTNELKTNLIEVQIQGQRHLGLIDTGSDKNLLNADIFRHLAIQPSSICLRSAAGQNLEIVGEANVELELGFLNATEKFLLVRNLSDPVILGTDLMQKHKLVIDMGKRTLGSRSPEGFWEIPLKSNQRHAMVGRVFLCNRISLAPHSTTCVEAAVKTKNGSFDQTIGIIEPAGKSSLEKWEPRPTLVTPENNKVSLPISNHTDEVQTLEKGQLIANYAIPELIAEWPITEETPDPGQLDSRNLDPEITELLHEYQDLMAIPGQRLGSTSMITHNIDTGTSPPVRSRLYRLPAHKRAEVEEQLLTMQKDGIIEQANSPWTSPIVVVRKPDQSIRLCIDYRGLNAVTVTDSYPMPNLIEAIENMANAKVFSCLDLKSGFWQIQLRQEDRPKTAFSSPLGQFQFKVLPFGVKNGPASFQRLMDETLRGLIGKCASVYLDDVLVYSHTREEHLQILRIILDRFRQANLKINPVKCAWLCTSVKYLGHVLDQDGIHPDPDKVEAIVNWPTPKSVRSLRAFIGTAGYYRRFIKNFAHIAKPLHHLLGKSTPFLWTEECSESLEKLKQCLVTSPILVAPEFSPDSGDFIVDCDASSFALGAVLAQIQKDGSERVVSYFSQSLNRAQQNYEATKREMLAVVVSLEKFKPYLWGRKFIIRTDHKSLTWLQNFRNPSGMIARWIARLQEYDYELQYRPGPRHQNCDGLSRREEFSLTQDPSQCDTESSPLVRTIWVSGAKRDELISQTRLDPNLSQFITWKTELSDPPPSARVMRRGPELIALVREWNNIHFCNGLLFYRMSGLNERVIVPKLLRERYIEQCHSTVGNSHEGERKTYDKVRSRFWWPLMRSTVQNFLKECLTCAEIKSPWKTPRAPLHPIITGRPNELICLDIVGPISEAKSGNKYILTILDHFTKWVEAIPLKEHTAPTIATALVTRWICRFGIPDRIVTDRGSEFQSKLMTELCYQLGIAKSQTSPYYPQSNGALERFHRTLRSALLALSEVARSSWDESLELCLWAYRNTVHSTTGVSPATATLGRPLRTPIDFELELSVPRDEDIVTYLEGLMQALRRTWTLMETHTEAAQRKQKKQHDKRLGGPRRYHPGDLVMLRVKTPNPYLCKKLTRQWEGPYRIIQAITPVTYHVRKRAGRLVCAHITRLKPFKIQHLEQEELEVEVEPSDQIAQEIEMDPPVPEAIREEVISTTPAIAEGTSNTLSRVANDPKPDSGEPGSAGVRMANNTGIIESSECCARDKILPPAPPNLERYNAPLPLSFQDPALICSAVDACIDFMWSGEPPLSAVTRLLQRDPGRAIGRAITDVAYLAARFAVPFADLRERVVQLASISPSQIDPEAVFNLYYRRATSLSSEMFDPGAPSPSIRATYRLKKATQKNYQAAITRFQLRHPVCDPPEQDTTQVPDSPASDYELQSPRRSWAGERNASGPEAHASRNDDGRSRFRSPMLSSETGSVRRTFITHPHLHQPRVQARSFRSISDDFERNSPEPPLSMSGASPSGTQPSAPDFVQWDPEPSIEDIHEPIPGACATLRCQVPVVTSDASVQTDLSQRWTVVDAHSHLHTILANQSWEQTARRHSRHSTELKALVDVWHNPAQFPTQDPVPGYDLPDIVVKTTFGCHPAHAHTWTAQTREAVERCLTTFPSAIAVGETGIDDTPGFPAPTQQQRALIEQALIAFFLNVPLVVHCRVQSPDHEPWHNILWDSLTHTGLETRRIHWHCCLAPPAVIRAFRHRFPHMYFGVTEKHLRHHQGSEIIREIPLERLVLESDAPYISQVPWRVADLVIPVARTKYTQPEFFLRCTNDNPRRLYQL
jgi:Tat protein secretion system quality control protein TatD with DNase activity